MSDTPSERQIEVAKSLGIDADESSSREHLSQLISRANKFRPATEYQIRRAADAGIDIQGGTTYAVAYSMIEEAENGPDRPASSSQIKSGEELGVRINKSVSYWQAEELITAAENNRPPENRQIDFFRRMGIKLGENWTRKKVEDWLVSSRDHPKFGPKIKDAEKAEQLEEYKEYYGDLAEDFLRWEKIADAGGRFILIFKKGKNVVAEIVEFDGLDLSDTKKPFIKIEILLPKRIRDRECGDYFEWEKESSVNAVKILHVEPVGHDADTDNTEDYELIKEAAEELAEKFR